MKQTRVLIFSAALLLISTAFSYSASDLRLVAPMGGENIKAGDTFKIRWAGSDLEGTLQILLVRDQKIMDTLHSTKVSYKGIRQESFDWKVSNQLEKGPGYTIRLICRLDRNRIITDENKSPFTISGMTMRKELPRLPSLRVIQPNGGETFRRGQTFSIRWTSEDDCSDVNITLLKGGIDERVIYTVLDATVIAPDVWEYRWTVPPAGDAPDGNDYKIRVQTNVGSVRVQDLSDSNFTISSLPVDVPRDSGGRDKAPN